MPVFGEVTLPDGSKVEPDTSCELNLKNFDEKEIQDAEKNNNNLHIWELGEMFKSIGENGGEIFKILILTPEPIAKHLSQF